MTIPIIHASRHIFTRPLDARDFALTPYRYQQLHTIYKGTLIFWQGHWNEPTYIVGMRTFPSPYFAEQYVDGRSRRLYTWLGLTLVVGAVLLLYAIIQSTIR